MARRRRGDDERSMDSLMDALTNVVGILLLILIFSSLLISDTVRKVVESLPEVTQEELEAMKVSRDKTLKNLEELKQTHITTQDNLPTKEEAAALVAELEEFEKNNKDLADKTSDIEEWKAKVDQEDEKKTANEEKVSVADARNRELAAILAQTPEPEIIQAKEVLMPNPRFSDPEWQALYLFCKNGRVYFYGDPYDHVLRVRDVIDQNFTDLAFTDKAIGSYTYAIKIPRRDDNDRFLSLTEKVRFSRRDKEAIAAWDQLKPTWKSREGVEAPSASILQRIVGNDDEAEFAVSKFRYDLKKVIAFFGDGKFGPKDFKYHVRKSGGDRVKLAVEPREEGGWTLEEALAPGSEFEQLCKKAATSRKFFFFYRVASDSFDTYLQIRSKSEQFRVPAGWEAWHNSDTDEPVSRLRRESTRYNLDILPDEEYMKLANLVGPYMVEELDTEHQELAERVEAAVPEELDAPEKAAEKKEFIDKLTAERLLWDSTTFQSYTMSIFHTALAAQEASGEEEIALEIHPPEIPGIRVFTPSGPPKAPTPPPDPNAKKPRPRPSGTGRLELD